jgi:hypothetical protein
VSEAAVFGEGLHVATSRAEEVEAAIRQTLAANNIALRRLARVPPTLEDAFVSLVDRAKG